MRCEHTSPRGWPGARGRYLVLAGVHAVEPATIIVVVENSDDVRAFVVYALEQEGYRVYATGNAHDGFELVARMRPALVITDVMLGVTSGFDLITRIRNELPPPGPAILACSGFPCVEGEAGRRGADLYLAKPFDLDSLRAAVASLLSRRPLSVAAVERAQRESRRLRDGAAAAAHAALNRLTPHLDDLTRRCEWSVRWLPAYFGFGRAFYAIERDGRLEVLASSAPDWLAVGVDAAERLPLCRDIVETSSAVVLPDTGALKGAAGVPGARFFAGVPLLSDVVAIGAFCLVDDERRNLEGEDLALLEAAGRRASALLTGNGNTPPFMVANAVVSRETLLLVTDLELRRARRSGAWVHLLAFASPQPEAASTWSEALDPIMTRRRRLIAAIGGDRFALLLVRPPGETERLVAAVRQLNEAAAIGGGGMVSMEGADVVGLSERELITLASGMLDRQLRLGQRGIEHVVIRREPWPAAAAAPAG